jgi:hypothetical protein
MAKRHYRLSPRLLRALEALASGAAETLGQAAQISGLTERALRYSIAKPHVREWLRGHVVGTFSAGQLAASRTMMNLLRSENSMSQFRAASWVLGVNGVAPADTRGPLVSINAGSGFVIDLRPNDERDRPLTEADRQALSTAGGVLLGSTRGGSMVEGSTAEPVTDHKPIDEQQ